jgi:hypothetical protein
MKIELLPLAGAFGHDTFGSVNNLVFCVYIFKISHLKYIVDSLILNSWQTAVTSAWMSLPNMYFLCEAHHRFLVLRDTV